MQIVINIPEKVVKAIQNGKDYRYDIHTAIAQGTPLPKGHGDLIDRDKIEYMKAIHDMKWGKVTAKECATKIRNSAPTIIEADAESEGKNADSGD